MTPLRNVALVAHVDHGKTTLVDSLLKSTGTFAAHQAVVEREANLVARDVFRFGDFQILDCRGFHFSFFVMISGLLCFLNTKKSTHRRTMSSAFALTTA